MKKMPEERFKFDLGSLSAGKYVKLSDAVDLAFYGGVRSVSYDGPTWLPAESDREYIITDAGEWLLVTDGAPLRGPRYIDIANPGAILFGIEDNSNPDPAQLAAAEKTYQARLNRQKLQLADKAARTVLSGHQQASAPYAPTPRQNDPNTIEPFWRAEIGRRRAEFMGKLNAAARSGDVRFRGRPVNKAWISKSSEFQVNTRKNPRRLLRRGPWF